MPPPTRRFTQTQMEGATWILRDALAARRGTSLLVLHDETTEDAAACIELAAHASGVSVVKLRVESSTQNASRKDSVLELAIRDEIDKVTCVVFLQRWSPGSTAFRFKVLDYCRRGRGKRAASMPGVTLAHFDMCRGDLEQLGAICRLYADRLLWATELKLLTRDHTGAARALHIPCASSTPRVSTGHVPLGGWCNVPSGETFFVPPVDRAEGEVVVNGSIPNYPIPPGEELTLRLHRGKVCHPIAYRGARLAAAGRRLILTKTGEEITENSSVLSELGIGLNGSINRFTGLPIFDEKKAGTVHIGLGSSTQFGGPTPSDVHNDLVIAGATLHIDTTEAIKEGVLCLTRQEAFPHWSRIPVHYFDPAKPILRTGELWEERREQGRILACRRWINERTEGEIATQIGDVETAAVATVILWALENRRPTRLDSLKAAMTETVPPGSLEPVLELLVRFGLVRQG